MDNTSLDPAKGSPYLEALMYSVDPLLTSPSMALFTSNYKEDHGPSTIFLSPILSSSMETLLTMAPLLTSTSLDPAKGRPYLEALMYSVTPLNASVI